MTPPFNVLFLCTANACRSQMAEAILRHLGSERFVVRSAGARPYIEVHPLARQAMADLGISMEGQHPKGISDLGDAEHDIVLTLCDSAACFLPPDLPGGPVVAHWGLEDPVRCTGDEAAARALAGDVARMLYNRIGRMVTLRLETLSRDEVRSALEAIARD